MEPEQSFNISGSQTLHSRASIHPLTCLMVHHQWPGLYLLRLAMGISSASYSQSWPCCSQRMEANTKQQSFHFQWAITQQHLGKRPCETIFFFFFFLNKAAVITSTPARPSLFSPMWDQNTKGISYLLCWIWARNRNFSHQPTSLLPPPPPPPPLFFFFFFLKIVLFFFFFFFF